MGRGMRKIHLKVDTTKFKNGGKPMRYVIEIDRDRGFLHVRRSRSSEMATITLEDLVHLVMGRYYVAKARADSRKSTD